MRVTLGMIAHNLNPRSNSMKRSPYFRLCAAAIVLALTPAVDSAEYQPAGRALEKLENCVNLTSAQKKQALQVFQKLKNEMDKMDPADRPTKGMQLQRDAKAAIRAILTPEQLTIYDRTPQRLGGGGTDDPGLRALRLRISAFAREVAQSWPGIAASVGTIQRIVVGDSIWRTPYSSYVTEPELHPTEGVCPVTVTGSLCTGVFRIFWKMDEGGEMTVDRVVNTLLEETPTQEPAAPPQPQMTSFQPIIGPDNAFNDQEFGVSFRLPAGWAILDAKRWGDHETTVFFSALQLSAPGPRLYYKIYQSPLGVQPGEIDSWLRTCAQMKAKQRIKEGLGDYMICPGSFVSREIGGCAALSWKADYTKDREKWAEYLTCVFSENGTALFFLNAPLDDIASAIHQFETMVATIKMP
jgi:hypothetical protein